MTNNTEVTVTQAEAALRERSAMQMEIDRLRNQIAVSEMLIGNDPFGAIAATLDEVGAPKWSDDKSIMFSIFDRIRALAQHRTRSVGELERAYGALRWIYINGMQVDRPQSVSDVMNDAFASHRIAQPDMPAPRVSDEDPSPKTPEQL